jgi:hypothetical protein
VEKKADYKVGDYLELEFELGDLEFEATGKSAVVEKLFKLLLEKICSGELKVFGEFEEEEEEEEEEKDKEEKEEEKKSEEREDDAALEPGPDWESLETESPPESPVERELEED